MKFAPLLPLIIGASLLPPRSAPAATPALLWSDEFNQAVNSAPDAKKWTYDLGSGGWGNNELETYTDSRANSCIAADTAATDGKALVIAAVKSASGAYTSARLKTQGKFTFTYGRVEARLKTSDGQGLWPACWMLGASIGTAGWPACGEIDIMETVGASPKIAYGTLHGPGYSGASGIGNHASPASGTLASAYHVYTVDWTPGKIVWSLDGAVYHTVTSATIPAGTKWVFNDSPFFLILNLAVGGYWPGYPDATTKFPGKYSIDYVRVYGWPGPAPTALAGYAARADQAQLSWTAPTLPSGVTLKGFRLERATDSAFTKGLKTFSLGKVTFYVDTTAAAGTTYYYRVSAITSTGTTDPTAAISVKTAAKNVTGTAALTKLSGTVFCGASANAVNLGFVIEGTAPRSVLLRAVGPALTATGKSAATLLADPVLTLYRSGKRIAANDDWKTNANAAAILTAQTATGAAPPLSAASKDAALLLTLAPGTYTLSVAGKSGGTGLVLVEIVPVP